MTRIALFLILAPGAAAAFEQPIPQAQSATAEGLFLIASLALVAALVVVQRLVARQ